MVVVTDEGSTEATTFGTLDSTMPASPAGALVIVLAIDADAAEAALAKVDALAASETTICAGKLAASSGALRLAGSVPSMPHVTDAS
jgi:hypothetical protein